MLASRQGESMGRWREAALVTTFLGVAALGLPSLTRAEESGNPLAITVHPSGYEPLRESLDEKLARRLRDSAHMFRSICRGCGRHEALLEAESGPFDPQASLAGGKAR